VLLTGFKEQHGRFGFPSWNGRAPVTSRQAPPRSRRAVRFLRRLEVAGFHAGMPSRRAIWPQLYPSAELAPAAVRSDPSRARDDGAALECLKPGDFFLEAIDVFLLFADDVQQLPHQWSILPVGDVK
jgi:hypothetical protein